MCYRPGGARLNPKSVRARNGSGHAPRTRGEKNEDTPLRNKKRHRPISADEIIAWIWENDDPAAAACESRHLDVSDQSVEATDLRVYNGLLACEPDKSDGKQVEAEGLDRTLANILVFADDCRAATEWLQNELVSHDDEQARRAGQRRRHLKERGLLENGKRFVRLCGQVVTDAAMITVMAARQCIDGWEETDGERSLHFHKCETGIRWQPCSTETGSTTRMYLGNPFSAPPAKPEADGRTVVTYVVSFSDDEHATAERSQWENAEEADVDDDRNDTKAQWVLNTAGETAVEWLAEAAETVAEIATENDDVTLRELFPSLREMKQREEREGAGKRAAEARKRHLTEGPASAGAGHSIH